jgi:RNA polymerase sigma-70 factor (ECF subfamily)
MWREYRTRLVRFVRSKVHDDVAAEDIVHDALVKAWTKRSSLQSEEALLPWLFQITMNAVRDHHRVRHHDVVSDLDPEDKTNSDDLQQIAECLTSMIDTLEEPYRSAIRRSEIDGVPMRVIADELNISLSGVKSRVQRGRAKLRDQIMACCQFEVNERGQITNGDEHQCSNPDCGCQAA